ncbi:hypothetical protein GALMADRAFT_241502 [Galerina marginata CBS 339.88]|uniref:RBR-type E3 ubiquitin transferase n=1 Tax=Galerina marginata (strain CBS 339.88) TaxID=685588 RepID=A0A067TPT0_GALM3|nr:hypothetical protein GALMADRAFT_241502 [Galerina marginata CBS 339.88]
MSAPKQYVGNSPSQLLFTRQKVCNRCPQGYCQSGASCKFGHILAMDLGTLSKTAEQGEEDDTNRGCPGLVASDETSSSDFAQIRTSVKKPIRKLPPKPTLAEDTLSTAPGSIPHSVDEFTPYWDWKTGNRPKADSNTRWHQPTFKGDIQQSNRTAPTIFIEQHFISTSDKENEIHPAILQLGTLDQPDDTAGAAYDNPASDVAMKYAEGYGTNGTKQQGTQDHDQAGPAKAAEVATRKKGEKLARIKVAKEARARDEGLWDAEGEQPNNLEARLAGKHVAKEIIQTSQMQMVVDKEQEAAALEQDVVLDSCLVTYTAGLEFRHIITSFDLCKITIRNLPLNAGREEISDLFINDGIEFSDFCIHQVRPDGDGLEAVVLANADHGQSIVLDLDGVSFLGRILSVQVWDNASWNTMDATARISPFLTVSWMIPSDTVIATYPTMEEAQEKARKLDMVTWKGRQIRAMMVESPQGFCMQRFVPSSIKIVNLPCIGRIETDLYNFTGAMDLRLLRSISYDLQASFNSMRRHLENLSGVQMHTYEVVSTGDRTHGEAKIKVRFRDWEDARSACTSINQIKLGVYTPNFRPWFFPPKPLRHSIAIPREQYEAQKGQWDALSEKNPEVDAYIEIKIRSRGDVFIQVVGLDKKAAGSLKVRVENMVAGEKLDHTYWHPVFESKEGICFFNRIYRENNVFVRTDFKYRSLRIFGRPEKVLQVRQMIAEEVNRLAQRETRRVLDPPCVGFFVREGLKRLKELLGEENANLDLASRPFSITIKGGDEAMHHLQRLTDEAQMAAFLAPVLSGPMERNTCPICTDEASNPERLGCGHAYCTGCLRHFLTSAANARNFPLVCMGNDATCRMPLSIPLIRRFVPPQVFRSLVEAAFLSYLDHHPQELKYCPTPDCKQVYRHRTDQATLQCPSCFSTICSSCDEEAHEGMTCHERKLSKDGEQERLNEQLAMNNGYKKCPQCKVWIEKTAGCNHMNCICGAHICWRCMEVFDLAVIYNHMRHAHGNIYGDAPARIDDPRNAGHNAWLRVLVDEVDVAEYQQAPDWNLDFDDNVLAMVDGVRDGRDNAFQGVLVDEVEMAEHRRALDMEVHAADHANPWLEERRRRQMANVQRQAIERQRQLDETHSMYAHLRQAEQCRRGRCIIM